jgi:hypothetical protein
MGSQCNAFTERILDHSLQFIRAGFFPLALDYKQFR